MKRMGLICVVGLMVAGIMMGLSVSGAFAAVKDNAKLRFFSDGSIAGGLSSLERSSSNGIVSANIKATHLTPGGTYTYWWVVFNLPDNCSPPDCGEDDLFDAPNDLNEDQINAVNIAVLGGNGEVANNGGKATFTGTLFEGSSLGNAVLIGPGGLFEFPYLLQSAENAEIHIIIRAHGPAQTGADLAEQLNTFWGNCTNVPVDDDPTFECIDEQFAIHK